MSNSWGDEAAVEVRPRWRRKTLVRLLLCACVVLAVPAGLVTAALQWERWKSQQVPVTGVIPAEFERHDAIALGWDGRPGNPQHDTLIQMAAAIHRHTKIILQVEHESARLTAEKALVAAGVPRTSIYFWTNPNTKIWTRDYFPKTLKQFDGSLQQVEFRYGGLGINSSDFLKPLISRYLPGGHERVDLKLQGGNLLSNGAGLCLTTRSVLVENRRNRMPESQTRLLLRKHFGADQLVVLEPIKGERTGHVDMFAAFVATDAVVIGQYRPDQDPVNAKILDENAEQLEGLETAAGPLRVIRIPMPDRLGDVYRTYTNVAFVNGVLLVPSYSGENPDDFQQVLSTYASLLPSWKLVPIGSDALINEGGSVHCVTMNLFRINESQLPLTNSGSVF